MSGLGWLELKASAELSAGGVLARLVDVALAGLGCDPSLCHDASLAVAELVNNVHEHEYAGGRGPVLIRLRRSAAELELEVESEGPPFDLQAALDAERDPLVNLEGGGFGLNLVAALFDSIQGLRDGEVNRTRLTKSLT